jgi:hypothetical protein
MTIAGVKLSKNDMIAAGVIAAVVVAIVVISKKEKDKQEKVLGYRPSQFKNLMRNA